MILGKLKQLVSSASAPSEQATKRDGAFSWKGETHAFIWGAGLGSLTVQTAVYAPEYVDTVVGVAVSLVAYAFGERTAEAQDAQVPRAVIREVRSEPQYLLGGLVVGAGLAVLAVAVLAVVGF